MRTTTIGTIPFATTIISSNDTQQIKDAKQAIIDDSKQNSIYNLNEPLSVNQAGGMKQVVRDDYARTIWYILRTFHVLPTDERFKRLTTTQIDFIIASLNEDARQARIANGSENADMQATDNSKDYEEMYNANHKVDLVDKRDNLDDIYEQVKRMTLAKGSEYADYDSKLDKKIATAIAEKHATDKQVDRQIAENWRNFEKDMKNRHKD